MISNWRWQGLYFLLTSSSGHSGDNRQKLYPLKVARKDTNFCFERKVSNLLLLRYSLCPGAFLFSLWESTAWVCFLRMHLPTHSSNILKCKQNQNKPQKLICATLERTVGNLLFNFRLIKVCLFLPSQVFLLGHVEGGSTIDRFFFLICWSLISHNGYGFYFPLSLIPLSFSTFVFIYFVFPEEYYYSHQLYLHWLMQLLYISSCLYIQLSR